MTALELIATDSDVQQRLLRDFSMDIYTESTYFCGTESEEFAQLFLEVAASEPGRRFLSFLLGVPLDEFLEILVEPDRDADELTIIDPDE